MQPAPIATIAQYLDEAPIVSSPQVSGPLAVFPLIGPMPVLEYQSFAQGQAAGVTIKELGSGASVRDLVVHNPTPLPVLLFEGEEVLGAQQNRTFDVSILVPAHTTLQVPVSCVEAGRWDGSRHSEEFTPAPQTAHLSLRALKNSQVAAMVAAGMETRADQGAVWEEVDHKIDELGAHSPTRAMDDAYANRREQLEEMCAAISMECSQTGMLIAIGGEFVVMDRISQPDVLESLHRPLVQGYALDALGVPEGDPPSESEAAAFLEEVMASAITEHDGIGLGRDVRLAGARVGGSGVVSGAELVQLSVFIDERDVIVDFHEAGRIRRPSRRGRAA